MQKLGCDNTKTRDPKCKYLLGNHDRSSAFTDEDLLRKYELFKEMFPEKKPKKNHFLLFALKNAHFIVSYPGLSIQF